LALDVAAGSLDRGERDRAILRDRPDETAGLPEIERQHRLAISQRRLDLLDRWRLWRDQVGVGRESPADFLPCLEPFGAERIDRGVDRLDALVVALSRRQRQHVVQRPKLSVDLLAEVLFLA